MTRILVAYGSKRGGTAGLAAMIGDALTEGRRRGLGIPGARHSPSTGFDAVVLAGALFANRWHRDAPAFRAEKHRWPPKAAGMAGQQRAFG